MIVSASQLRGVPKDRAELYGKPHVGARYVGNRYELAAERCGICGRQATNCHHIVPRRCGDFALVTPRGTWRLRSPLIALCGSGTTGCHDGVHGGA